MIHQAEAPGLTVFGLYLLGLRDGKGLWGIFQFEEGKSVKGAVEMG